MGIINTGVFDTEDIFKRATGNDWPVAEAIVASGGGGGTDLTGNTTTDLAEGANLYFSNTRVVEALIAGDNIIIESNGRISSTATAAASGTDLSANTTTDLAEGDNLYYTNARVVTAVDPKLTTANVIELTNLYFTDARVVTVVDPKLTTANVTETDNLYYTNARVDSYVGSTTFSNISAVTVTANSFVSSGFGVPTIEAETNIVLSANGYNGAAVVIQNSPLRIRSYTEANLSSLTPATGDIVFNSTIQQLQVYGASAWGNVGSGALNLEAISSNLIPSANEVYNLGSLTHRWKDLYLSGNTLVLGNTTLSADGGELVVGSIKASSFTATGNPNLYTAGRGIAITQSGVISTSADDSDFYDVSIDQQSSYFVTDSMETAVTIPGTAGRRYLLHSFLITNISDITAEFDCNVIVEGNTHIFANAYSIPYSYTIDLVDVPVVLMPNTTIKMKSAANNSISTTLIYKTFTDDNSYDSKFTTIDQTDTFRTIYEAYNSDVIVESIKILNHSENNLRGTIILTDSSDTLKSYLAANSLLAGQYYSDMIINPLRLLQGDKIKFANFNGDADCMTTYVSARLGEVYNVSANTTTISEGDIVVFSVTTNNVPNGTTRYFRTSGNVISDDFVSGNTGTFTVVDSSATVTLQANSDITIGSEGEETFQLQILSGSITGTLLKTSEDIVLIKDTSNTAGVGSLSVSSNVIYGSEATVITVNALNAPGNAGATFYYTITGNADIYSNTSGAIIIDDNTANLEIITEASVPSDEVRSFAVQIRNYSTSGPILDTSDTIRVYSADTPGISATGGNQILEIDI